MNETMDIECRENVNDMIHEQQDTEVINKKKQKQFECELCGNK